MKWRDHIIILKNVLNYLNIKLDEKFIKNLFEGVIEPDIKHDIYLKNRKLVRQHDARNRELVNYYLKLSIYLYIRGRGEEAGKALGRAIHYAQDLLLKRRKYLIIDIHDKLEEEIHKICLSIDNNTIRRCIEGREITRSNDPYKIVCSSIRVTYIILKKFIEYAVHGRWKYSVARDIAILLALSSISYAILTFISIYLSLVSTSLLATVGLSIIFLKYRYVFVRPKTGRFRTVI